MTYKDGEIVGIDDDRMDRVMDVEWNDNCPLCNGELGFSCVCEPDAVGAFFFARQEALEEVENMISNDQSASTGRPGQTQFFAGKISALREVSRILRAAKKVRCKACDLNAPKGQSHRSTCNNFSYGIEVSNG